MIQHQECLPDDETDLNELTVEQHDKRLADGLARFWASQATEMEALEIGTEQDFKNHNDLPLARIKRIMKSDEDVRMISAEAPILFAKACEMFILELTLRCLYLCRLFSFKLLDSIFRSWCHSEHSRRRTLQKEDVQAAIRKTDSKSLSLNHKYK